MRFASVFDPRIWRLELIPTLSEVSIYRAAATRIQATVPPPVFCLHASTLALFMRAVFSRSFLLW